MTWLQHEQFVLSDHLVSKRNAKGSHQRCNEELFGSSGRSNWFEMLE